MTDKIIYLIDNGIIEYVVIEEFSVKMETREY